MGKLNKSGKYGSGKNRSNAPAASDKAKVGDSWARKFDNFSNVGGSNADTLQPGKVSHGGAGPSNTGNEY